MKISILHLQDVKQLVDTFYAKVQKDDLIGPVFNTVIKDRWPEHLDKMYRFWQTILLEEHTYYGSPFPPHAKLPIEKIHFERWLNLFYSNIDDQFDGEKANEAKWRATKMAEMFQMKLDFLKNTKQVPLV